MKTLEKIAKRTVDGFYQQGMTSEQVHSKIIKMQREIAKGGNDEILVNLMMDYENQLFLSDL